MTKSNWWVPSVSTYLKGLAPRFSMFRGSCTPEVRHLIVVRGYNPLSTKVTLNKANPKLSFRTK